MSIELTTEARKRLCEAHGISPAYLYQCMRGLREMDAGEARRLEDASNGELRRWMVRPLSWHRIWPELIGTEGAPGVPVDAGK